MRRLRFRADDPRTSLWWRSHGHGKHTDVSRRNIQKRRSLYKPLLTTAEARLHFMELMRYAEEKMPVSVRAQYLKALRKFYSAMEMKNFTDIHVRETNLCLWLLQAVSWDCCELLFFVLECKCTQFNIRWNYSQVIQARMYNSYNKARCKPFPSFYSFQMRWFDLT